MNIEQIELRLGKKSSSPMFARLASEYLASNRIEDAKNLCVSGLNYYPNYSTAYFIMAKCLVAENNRIDALAHLQKALIFDPNSTLLKEYCYEIDPEKSDIDKSNFENQQPEFTSKTKDEFVNESVEIAEQISTNESTTPMISEIEIPVDPHTDELHISNVEYQPQTKYSELNDFQIEEIDLSTDEESDVLHLEIESNSDITIEQLSEYSPEDQSTSIQPVISNVDTNESSEMSASITNPESESHQELSVKDISADESIEAQTIKELQLDDHQISEISNIDINELPLSSSPEEILHTKDDNSQTEDRTIATFNQSEITEGGEKLTEDAENRIVSRTLAEIYVSQGEYAEAIDTYRYLKRLHPELQHEIDSRIKELEIKLQLNSGE